MLKGDIKGKIKITIKKKKRKIKTMVFIRKKRSLILIVG